jgi:malate dehydrogenase
VILGVGGVERIIELELSDDERAAFQKSVDAVKGLVETMGRLTATALARSEATENPG